MEDRVVRQIFGAVARGQLALQEEETKYQPLRVDDMVFLQTDSNVQAWVLSSGPDPFDILVVFEDASTNAGDAEEDAGNTATNAGGAEGDTGNTGGAVPVPAEE